MTVKEIKSEIQKSMDKVPESVPKDILDFLKSVENKSREQLNLAKNLRNILAEDKELLERLAILKHSHYESINF
jgi:mRNA-degrading endonuclease RelE of RelBE toxin-antitoxin system